ncbi:Deoxyribodipyrimidine photolyase [Rhodovulum sp. PH10]|uniref:cryptochrome/photolyase family protein n=1 Tax=Rhodovulum sp. PH10 TaxID=1187851 RepID=UPI00027C2D50|nr:deoxyribodipyrimidine photo-lyase [Rhodovulum sp. PH10]EJW10001.1 Deoxyribodipyrimidine photolyase [Rhodovulum sp. PH10]
MTSPDTSKNPPAVLVWFRDDLRVADHPALDSAARKGLPVAALFVLDEESPGLRPLGGAARWWLAGSLRALGEGLAQRGVTLVLRRGGAATVVPEVAAAAGATTVAWNRRYEPAAATIDRTVEAALARQGVAVETFQASLLAEPEALRTKSGKPFAVFTPFLRAVLAGPSPRAPLPAPGPMQGVEGLASDALDDWALEPQRPDWAGGLRETWTRGEAAAQARLSEFVEDGLAGYADKRDRPDLPHTSRLSPRLRFGELSPFQVFSAAALAREAPPGRRPSDTDVDKFVAELVWREFSWHLLAAHPDIATANIQEKFDAFPWRDDPAALSAWQRGETGYPIVDAGMRELWTTGWMHNRVRMVAASFLVKHLLTDWRAGERWFQDTLVDADAASNPASWQWVAGSGADAAPYFRIFNPVLQGRKFDPAGDYVRQFVPALRSLPAPAVHAPFAARPLDLAAAGVTLGKTYPAPVVDLEAGRERALDALARSRRPHQK